MYRPFLKNRGPAKNKLSSRFMKMMSTRSMRGTNVAFILLPPVPQHAEKSAANRIAIKRLIASELVVKVIFVIIKFQNRERILVDDIYKYHVAESWLRV